jgi:hypothetical protein
MTCARDQASARAVSRCHMMPLVSSELTIDLYRAWSETAAAIVTGTR